MSAKSATFSGPERLCTPEMGSTAAIASSGIPNPSAEFEGGKTGIDLMGVAAFERRKAAAAPITITMKRGGIVG
ncbi:MAG: hypothetical protein WCJ31_22320, partial [Planctomycetia bacterium]